MVRNGCEGLESGKLRRTIKCLYLSGETEVHRYEECTEIPYPILLILRTIR